MALWTRGIPLSPAPRQIPPPLSSLSSQATNQIDSTTRRVIRVILASSPRRCPQTWKWHGTNYLGAVHSTVGILTQIVLSDPSRTPDLDPDLAHLLSRQIPDGGNWPSSLPASRCSADRLVQVCHGVPGVVLSVQTLRPHFPDRARQIDSAVAAARDGCIRGRGMLTKEPCLCHSMSGNA
ncbi:hypothetical protein F5148DRAFT_1178619, partial [Russula earlei]